MEGIQWYPGTLDQSPHLSLKKKRKANTTPTTKKKAPSQYICIKFEIVLQWCIFIFLAFSVVEKKCYHGDLKIDSNNVVCKVMGGVVEGRNGEGR